MSPPKKHVCVLEARNAGERRWNERSQLSYHFFLFNYCYYYWNTKREPLRRRGARGTRKRNAKWPGCGRSGLALFNGSHRSPLEENSSLVPTLCQGVTVPSAFFVFFFPSGKSTAKYAKLPSFFWITSVAWSLSGLSKIFKQVLRLGYPREDVPGYTLKGVYYNAQIEERVSMVDKKKVDSLLLIPQSALAVEDLNMSCSLCWNWTSIWSITVLQPTS